MNTSMLLAAVIPQVLLLNDLLCDTDLFFFKELSHDEAALVILVLYQSKLSFYRDIARMALK